MDNVRSIGLKPPIEEAAVPAKRFLVSLAVSLGRLAVQVGMIVGAALAYFGVRGLTEGNEALAIEHGAWVLRLERVVGLDIEASLQDRILDHQTLVTAANWVYIWGHWPVIAATLIWLYRRHRSSYLLLRNAMFISGAIGLVIFMAFPVAPPRLMPGQFVDTVTELSTSYRLLQPPALINKFAAVPSLHVGWNLLVGLAIYARIRNQLGRALAAFSPVVMALATVLTANHYIFDAVAGSVVAVVGLAAAAVLACRHRASASAITCESSKPWRRHSQSSDALGQAA